MEHNPYAPPRDETPAPGLQPDVGVWGRRIQIVLLAGMICIHLFFSLGSALMVEDGKSPLPLLDDSQSVGTRTGGLLAWFAMAVWGPMGTVWATANIVALVKRYRWAYPSVLAYWTGNILVCLCSPFGVVGLLHAFLSKAGRWRPTAYDPRLG